VAELRKADVDIADRDFSIVGVSPDLVAARAARPAGSLSARDLRRGMLEEGSRDPSGNS
jgi:hypothetical protein